MFLHTFRRSTEHKAILMEQQQKEYAVYCNPDHAAFDSALSYSLCSKLKNTVLILVAPLSARSRLQHLKSLKLEWIFPEVVEKVLVGLESLLPRLESLELYGFGIPPMAMGTPSTLRSLCLCSCMLDVSLFGCMCSLHDLSLLESIECVQGSTSLNLASVVHTLAGIGSLRKLVIDLEPFMDSVLESDGQAREASEWASQIREFDLMRSRGVEIIVQQNLSGVGDTGLNECLSE